MTQDERWLTRYHEVKTFIETNHRNPSRHRLEEHDMLNWLKANRKKMNAGELKVERVEMFQKILTLIEENKRKTNTSERGLRKTRRTPPAGGSSLRGAEGSLG